MRIPKVTLSRTGIFLCFWAASSCSMSSSKDDPALHVDLSSYQDRSGQFALLNGGSLLQGLAPPQSATGFQCYGVNVTGPGIMDTSTHPEADPMLTFQQTLAGGYCTYRGVVTPPILLNATGSADVALMVPPGGVRLVQVFGVNDPLICTSGNFGNDASSGTNSSSSGSGGGKYFELGRGVVPDLYSDRSVEVTTTWPTAAGLQGDLDRAARALDCGGNCIHPIDGPSDGLTNFNSSLAITSNTGTLYAAQRFTVPATTYLRRVEVAVSTSAAGFLTAQVYEMPSSTALLNVDDIGGPAQIATAQASIAANIAGMVSLDFYDPNYFYRVLNPNKNYFIVFLVSNGTATFKTTQVSTVGVTGSVSTLTSSASPGAPFTVTSDREMFMRINACN